MAPSLAVDKAGGRYDQSRKHEAYQAWEGILICIELFSYRPQKVTTMFHHIASFSISHPNRFIFQDILQ